MGTGKVGPNSSRSEFMSSDVVDGDIEYRRDGGCFVTTRRAIFFLFLAIASIIAVAIGMYCYGPNRKHELVSHFCNNAQVFV